MLSEAAMCPKYFRELSEKTTAWWSERSLNPQLTVVLFAFERQCL